MSRYLQPHRAGITAAFIGVTALALASCSTGADETSDLDTDGSPSSTAYVGELNALLPDDIRDAGSLTVGAPYALRPSIYTDDAGDPIGISVDMSEAFGEILGIDFEWQETADPVTGLQSGAIDVSMGFLSASPSREEVLTMVPQFLNTSTLLVDAGSDVTDIESLCGEVLAVVSGSQQEISATAISEESCAGEPIDVTSFAGAGDAITQVQSGRASAFVAPRMILEDVVDSSNGAFAVTDADYPDYPFAMGVTLDNADLADALVGALQEIVDNGTYAAILEEWGVADIALSDDQIGVNLGSTDAFAVNE